MEKKQTAVEYYAEKDVQLTIDFLEGRLNQIQLTIEKMKLLNQAKRKENEQIAKAWDDGDHAYFYSKQDGSDFENGEQYYNETYGKETDCS